MRKFINRTLISVLPLFLTIVFVSKALGGYETTYRAKHYAFQSAKDHKVSLVFGNSHASYAVNSDSIKSNDIKVINVASPSQKLNEDLFILKKLINEKQPKIQSILLSIDYHSLYSNQTKGIQLNWIRNEYGDHEKSLIQAYKYVVSMGNRVVLSGIKKKYTGIKYWDAEEGTNNQSVTPSGFLPFIGEQEGWRSTLRYSSKIQGFNHKMSIETIESSLEIIDSIWKICDDNNIRVYLFTAPTFTDYNMFLDKKQLAVNDSLIELICDKYNLSHFNYMEDTAFKAKHFYNADHLNEYGSTLLAKKLTVDLFEPSNISASGLK